MRLSGGQEGQPQAFLPRTLKPAVPLKDLNLVLSPAEGLHTMEILFRTGAIFRIPVPGVPAAGVIQRQPFRQGIGNQPCEVSGMQDMQLVKGTGSRHIQQLGMSVLHRIFLSRGIQDKYGVEFQAFVYSTGSTIIPLSKTAFSKSLSWTVIYFPISTAVFAAFSVSAYHGNGIITIFLPASAHCRGLPGSVPHDLRPAVPVLSSRGE